MARELRILMVEDSPEDAELNAHELRHAGLSFVSRRVQTRDAFVKALQEFLPDVVLTDCRLPAFDGREALAIARQRCPDAVVIIVTGALGDEVAVELLRAGARDYVLKDRLARLPAAVLRALEEEEEGRRRRAAEQVLRHNQAWLEGQREVLELIARGEALPRVLDQMARLLDGLLPGTRSALFLLDREAAALRLLAAPGFPEESRQAMASLSLGTSGTCAAAVAGLRPLIVADISGELHCGGCRPARLGSAWAFPLLNGAGEAMGALVVHGQAPGEPDPDQRRIIEAAAPIAALAVERSRIARLQESMLRAERMAAMGALVAGVAHEVRNPLFAMSVNIDALALVLKGREDVQELLRALCEERDRISHLMEDLLSYGRPPSGQRFRSALEPVVQAALRGCAAIAGHLGVGLEREGSAEGLEVVMDVGRMEEVLHNILENACRHTPRGGRVLLGVDRIARASGPRVRLCVRDQGPGFSGEALERAFEPFFTRRRGGTGLGLAIVQRIVEEHEGTVSLANQDSGGALAAVELPLAP
jgi:signal transduction histidine kinase/DNA-binding response OmpR family regulator